MADFFPYIINNSFWAKALAALVLLVYLRKIGANPAIPILGEFRRIAYILLFTDALQFVFPTVWFPALWAFSVLQALGVLYCYYRVLAIYNAGTKPGPWFWILGSIATALGVAAPLWGRRSRGARGSL